MFKNVAKTNIKSKSCTSILPGSGNSVWPISTSCSISTTSSITYPSIDVGFEVSFWVDTSKIYKIN